METVYAIFDDQDHCCYLYYSNTDYSNSPDECLEYYEQCEEMNEWNWEEFLSND